MFTKIKMKFWIKTVPTITEWDINHTLLIFEEVHKEVGELAAILAFIADFLMKSCV